MTNLKLRCPLTNPPREAIPALTDAPRSLTAPIHSSETMTTTHLAPHAVPCCTQVAAELQHFGSWDAVLATVAAVNLLAVINYSRRATVTPVEDSKVE